MAQTPAQNTLILYYKTKSRVYIKPSNICPTRLQEFANPKVEDCILLSVEHAGFRP